MSPLATFSEGRHLPSPVSRVLAFGYSDGPTDGVLQVGEAGPIYRFALTADQPDLGEDVRLFELASLPADTLDTLTTLLSPYARPHWPTWVPRWMFPGPQVQADVEARVEEVLRQAGPVAWRVATTDLLGVLDIVEKVAAEESRLNGSSQKEGTHATPRAGRRTGSRSEWSARCRCRQGTSARWISPSSPSAIVRPIAPGSVCSAAALAYGPPTNPRRRGPPPRCTLAPGSRCPSTRKKTLPN
jgi:hypothetical protein